MRFHPSGTATKAGGERSRHRRGGGTAARGICGALIVVSLIVGACSRERRYVKPVPAAGTRHIILPGQATEPTLRPYVVNGERYYPIPDAQGFVQHGKVSWYGKKFHNRLTASGEVYDMYKKSAAHKTLPMGTYVKVINLSNNRQTVVRINDRGPFVKGRILDLSYASAQELGLVGPGIADAKVVALGRQVGAVKSPGGVSAVVELGDMESGDFAVQVGAFGLRSNALRLADRLKVIFECVEVSSLEKEDGGLFRVRVTKSRSLTEARKIEKRLEEMGFREAFVVSL